MQVWFGCGLAMVGTLLITLDYSASGSRGSHQMSLLGAPLCDPQSFS